MHDPCPLPEELKKRSLVEKEKLVYAPFSGVGGIVYDKDAVYVELKNTQSQMRKDEDSESANIVANLFETRETTDVKIQQPELQIFTGGKKVTAMDFEDDNDLIDQDSVQLFEKPSVTKSVESEDLKLEEELKKLRKKSYQEEQVEHSGRIRRKVVFNPSDTEEQFDNSESDSDEEGDSSGSFKVKSQPEPKARDDVCSKIKEVLNELESKKSLTKEDSSDEDSESSEDEDAENLNEDDSDDEDFNSDENIDSENDVNEGESGDEDDEDTTLKWKDNLAKKAQDAFLDRISSNQNLMKLVYGKLALINPILLLKMCVFLGVFDTKFQKQAAETEAQQESDNEEEDIGGIFKKVSKQQQKLKSDKDNMNLMESSLMFPWNTATKDWTDEEVSVLFVILSKTIFRVMLKYKVSKLEWHFWLIVEQLSYTVGKKTCYKGSKESLENIFSFGKCPQEDVLTLIQKKCFQLQRHFENTFASGVLSNKLVNICAMYATVFP